MNRYQSYRRIALVVGILLAVGFIFYLQTSRTWQFEHVEPGVLYRASMRNMEEFVAATLQAKPNSLVLVGGADERLTGVYSEAIIWAQRNSIRLHEITVPPDEFFQVVDLPPLLTFMERRQPPTLIVDTNGARAGMVVAALRMYQLGVSKEQAMEKAQLPDAPPHVTQTIRQFIEENDHLLKRVDEKTNAE